MGCPKLDCHWSLREAAVPAPSPVSAVSPVCRESWPYIGQSSAVALAGMVPMSPTTSIATPASRNLRFRRMDGTSFGGMGLEDPVGRRPSTVTDNARPSGLDPRSQRCTVVVSVAEGRHREVRGPFDRERQNPGEACLPRSTAWTRGGPHRNLPSRSSGLGLPLRTLAKLIDLGSWRRRDPNPRFLLAKHDRRNSLTSRFAGSEGRHGDSGENGETPGPPVERG